jgi:serine/threonine protein kinase
VFSFGVVLLEIITGRPPIGTDLEGGNLIQWVHNKLSGGDIESIVDPRMQEKYDINSVWKVTDLACKCTELASSKRPTMTALVTELKESLDLEMSLEEIHIERKDNLLTDTSQNSTIGMPYIGDMPVIGPNAR